MGAFHNFFDDGSVGSTLFICDGGIRSYLTVQDLVSCSKTGRTLHKLCQTYTVPELLQTKSRQLSKSIRIKMGTMIMKRVKRYHQGSKLIRPTRVIWNQETEECFRAKLYHPQELDQVNQIIDSFLNKYGEPVEYQLISAYFNRESDSSYQRSQGYDVTRQVKRLIEENSGWLKLTAPPLVTDGKGYRAKKQPSTFTWWYTRLFGDPYPGKTKKLIINTLDPLTGNEKRHEFSENTSVKMKLILC